MDGRTKRQIVAAFAIWAAITALLFWTGLVNRQKVWANPQLSWEAGETYRSDTAGYGVKSSGPYLDLAAGEYRLQWHIEGGRAARRGGLPPAGCGAQLFRRRDLCRRYADAVLQPAAVLAGVYGYRVPPLGRAALSRGFLCAAAFG